MNLALLDIGGTAIKYCKHDSDIAFEEWIVRECPTQASRGGEAVICAVQDILDRMQDLDAIALSTAGQINPDTGTVVFATDNIPGYTGSQIKRRLEKRYGVPVFVENDVNAAAMGEAAYGAGKEYSDFLCLTYGTGIGGAIVVNKKIYYGSSFSAGEMGHMVTHFGGEPCTCGNRGCYERYASTSALIRRVRQRTGMDMSGRQIFEKLHQQPEIRAIVDAWIAEVIAGLVSLIHIFNPQAVVLGGGVMAQSYIAHTIRQGITGQLMQSYRHTRIHQAVLGNTAGLQGMRHIALQGL